jgi:hypothetical protein
VPFWPINIRVKAISIQFVIIFINNKSFPLLLFFKVISINNIIFKKRENKLNINNKNKNKNVLLY